MPLTFSQRVLKLALSIPKGRVTTYGRLARAAGGGGLSAQSITGILGKAHDEGAKGSKNIPFHRIVYADGRVWLHSDAKRRAQRLALYKREGILIEQIGRGAGAKDRVVDFAAKVWEFR